MYCELPQGTWQGDSSLLLTVNNGELKLENFEKHSEVMNGLSKNSVVID